MREVLSREEWTRRERAHQDRVSRWTEPFLERRSRGEKHPVEDFLFTYYTLSPAQFTRWHPGPGVLLLDAPERADWKFYRPATAAELAAAELAATVGAPEFTAPAPELPDPEPRPHEPPAHAPSAHDLPPHRPPSHATAAHEPTAPGAREAASGVVVDADAFLAKRETAVKFTREILANTAAKTGTFDCFGLHEWAMAYRADENGVRHENAALRLGASGTDAVVEGHRIRCSHFDAFRFFQPQAVERNELQPTREAQRTMEQPGCLHASMDLYKWAYKLLPAVDSELLADCFELAWDVRVTDMEASPYDLADWGYEPVRIETPEGKAEYVRRQRAFAARGTELRHRLVTATDRILAAAA
ncbi:3-methyladenine DNA glycosylase [Kocuria rhizophila]|uniref:3-methyladenine DNA glycosylase n=1 Tax=Kocuria rhizophila TaxID=72000 RepID=UPI002E13F36E|nr:3-methyladenine DNA glycosylase [Kocuria rhizophila]